MKTTLVTLLVLAIAILIGVNIAGYYNNTETHLATTHIDLQEDEVHHLTPSPVLEALADHASRSAATPLESTSTEEPVSIVEWGIGPTQDERLLFLMNSYNTYKRTGRERGLANRCVVTILRESGRADYGVQPEFGEHKGFSLRPDFPDEYRIASDRALYVFARGEFPAYDLMSDRQKAGDSKVILTEEQEAAYENLYEEALNTLGIYSAEKPG